MWIIARILIAIGAALYRYLFRRTPAHFDKIYNGSRYSYKEETDKNGKFRKSYLEFPFEAPLVCCFQPETSFDRFLLGIGIGDEITVNDSKFDQQIYIVGDHPSLARYIQIKNTFRKLLSDSIGGWLHSLSITGKTIRFEMKKAPDWNSVLPNCLTFIEELSDMEKSISARFSDQFYTRAIIAESIVWAICGYALSTYMEWELLKEDYHLLGTQLIPLGLTIAGALVCIGMILLLKFLGRSSYAPRVIGESFFLLLIALPIAGIEIVSDVNRGLDNTPGTEIVRSVSHCEMRTHRGRKGRKYYTYHLYFDTVNYQLLPHLELPTNMQVNSTVYQSAQATHKVTVKIAPGFLKIPWYREIH